ncbi:MAG TPA: DUF6159 family protein [Acidothermaceae bacterium]
MSSPAAADPYGYFEDEPVSSPVVPVPVYAEPAVQLPVPGAYPTPRHIARTSRSFYPVGSRVGVFGNISAGFRLLPTCVAALMADPTLLFVPLVVLFVGGVASAGYVALFGGLAHLLTGGSAVVAVKTLPLAVVLAVVSVVGRAVVVADATQRLQGAKPRIDMAWRLTVTRLPALIGFGVAQAVESTMTAALRNSAAGRIAANVTDKAWDFATFLAVPAILFEKVGPLAAVRRSGSLVASRWGTQLTAQAVLSFAIAVCTIPLAVIAIVVASANAALGIGLLVAILLAAIAVSSALNGILSAAMYRFATTGMLAPGFDEADMWSVFAGR